MDPLSITAGAVGILSFGITVCQGLAGYYGSWKDCPDEIIALCQYLERVSNTMRSLEICVGKHTFPVDSVGQVLLSIKACEGHLERLEEKLEAFGEFQTSDGQKSLKSLVLRAQFPFREKTLKQIKDTVTCLETTLSIAIGTLGMVIGPKGCGNPGRGVHHHARRDSDTSRCEAAPKTTEQTSQALPAIQSQTTSIISDTQIVKESMANIDRKLQSQEALLLLLTLIYGQLEEQKARQLQIQYISKPGLLKEACENVVEFDHSQALDSSTLSLTQNDSVWNKTSRCTCKDVYNSGGTWRLASNLDVIRKSTKNHRKICPLYNDFTIEYTNIIGLKAIFGGFLSRAVEISVSLTRGAGGFSVSPNLTLKSMIRESSPAFDLFLENHPVGSADHSSAFIDKCLHELKVIYREGNGSPYDVDCYGRTVLHIALENLSWKVFRIDDQLSKGRKRLLLGMALLHVPVNSLCFPNPRRGGGSSVLGQITWEERITKRGPPLEQPLAPILYEFGGFTSPEEFPFSSLINFKIIGGFPEYVDFYGGNALSETVLAKVQEPFERTLLKYPDRVNEKNKRGQTPLHLAAGWPFASHKLLSAGAAVCSQDDGGKYPIEYATALNDLESVEALLDADSCVFFPPREESLGPPNREDKMISPRQKRFDLFLKALVDRRRRLAVLAEKIIPPLDLSRIIESSSGLLDGKASEVYQLIKSRGYPIPFALKVPANHSTVFHNYLWTPIEMEKLYQAGFREIDTIDKSFVTPFMAASDNLNINKPERLQWLLSKGADPSKRVGGDNIGQISYLAVAVAWRVQGKTRRLHGHVTVSYSDAEDFADAAFDEFAPYVRLLSQNTHQSADHNCRRRWKKPQKYTKAVSPRGHPCVLAYRYAVAFFGDWILRTLHGQQEIPESSFYQIIRTFLFDELRLTHTCCKVPMYLVDRFKSRPPDEVTEIQDEEKELISKLEDLCAEAKERRKTYQGTFCDFLVDFIHEVDEREENKVTMEDVRELREVGVVLDPNCGER